MRIIRVAKTVLAKTVKTAGSVTAYHGTPSEIGEFDISYTGKGHDQEGPGIYFSNEYEDSHRYTGSEGKVIEVVLNLNKVVPLSGVVSEDEIRKLLLWSMGLSSEDQLEDMEEEAYYDTYMSNWGEYASSAFESAVDVIMRTSKTLHEAFQSVWYDHYRHEPMNYLQGMVKLGYDGVAVPKSGVIHYIMYNTSAIQRI